jgi:hypothetical protein
MVHGVVICEVAFSWCPINVKLVLLDSVTYPANLMSIAHDHCCLMLSFAMPHAVELSVCTGVGGCGYPISSRVVHKMVAFLVFSNSAPISASKAEAKTEFMMAVVARTVSCVVSSLVLQFPM